MTQAKSTYNSILKLGEWLIFIVILLIGLIVLSPLLPSKNFASAYSVVSGSMEPTIPTGSLAFVQSVDANNLKSGDIIAFTAPTNANQTIIHRIEQVETSAVGPSFTTKGDNNSAADTWTITPSSIKGLYTYNIPYVGYLISWLKTPLGFGLAIVLPAVIFAFFQIRKIRQGIEEEIDRRTKHAQASLISIDSSPSSHKQKILSLTLLLILSATTISSAHALFSSQVEIRGITIATAPLTTPTPTPIPTPTTNHLVINEVYYHPANQTNSSSCNQGLTIINTGHNVTINQLCQIITSLTINQHNQSIISQYTSSAVNTGGNQSSGNINGGSISTGSATVQTTMSATLNQNSVSVTLSQVSSSSQLQWIELYNPTDQDINLQNWQLTSSAGTHTINQSTLIPSHSFAIIAASSTILDQWTIPPSTVIILLNQLATKPLLKQGDYVSLSTPQSVTVDTLSYGSNTSQLNPSIPVVNQGQSSQRQPLAHDTDQAADFVTQNTPTPGQ